MADPLSLTLAAITLATAIKDMVELAQLIDESFEKVFCRPFASNRHVETRLQGHSERP